MPIRHAIFEPNERVSTWFRRFRIAVVSLSSLLFSPVSGRAWGQGADAFGPSSANAPADAVKSQASKEGLQSATPSDNMGEFDESDATLDDGSQFSDLPEMTNPSSSPPKESREDFGNEGGNNHFGDGNLGKSDGSVIGDSGSKAGADASNSAFGKGEKNGSANAAPGNSINTKLNSATAPNSGMNQVVKAEVAPEATGQGGLVGPTPAAAPEEPLKPTNAGPSNAQILMNDITKETSSPVNIAPQNAGVPGDNTASRVKDASNPLSVPSSTESQLPGNAASQTSELPPPNEFAGAPPVSGTLRVMAEGEAPEEYRVQPGDTLFDICDQLIDEPGYWPKLWSLNPEIKNPHFIFPGMRLGFYPGDDDTPPFLQVMHEEDVIPIDKGSLDELVLVKEKVILAEELAATQAEEITEVIGPDQVESGAEVSDQILLGGRLYDPYEVRVQVPGFIFSEEKAASGFVLGGREGGISTGSGGDIVIEKNSQMAAGQLYSILRPDGEIRNPETNEVIGELYYLVANVRTSRTVGDDILIGKVQDSRLGAQADDIVVDYISSFRTLPLRSVPSSFSAVNATVIAFEDSGRQMGGNGHFAFIDKGNSDGVSPGTYMRIYQKPGYLLATSDSSELPNDWAKVGTMRIIDVTNAGSVGYIIENSQEIRAGDVTKKP